MQHSTISRRKQDKKGFNHAIEIAAHPHSRRYRAAYGSSSGGGKRGATGSVLSVDLAEVREIIGSPVVVFEPSPQGPTVRGNLTGSSCVWMPPGSAQTLERGRKRVFLSNLGIATTLSAGYDAYMKRQSVAQIKRDVLATAVVSNGKTVVPAASRRLLDAVLKKL